MVGALRSGDGGRVCDSGRNLACHRAGAEGEALGPAGHAAPVTPRLPAYESFLKARYFLRKFSKEAVARGKEYLEQAIALDPSFALAHAEMATYFRNSSALVNAPALEALPQARRAAQRALAIDPLLPEAHAELATAAVFLDYDWEAAERHFQLAMTHDPIPATVSHSYGFFYLLPLGRVSEATEELERALKEDPLNVLCRTQLAVCHWTQGRNEQADREFRQALELDENFWLALLVYAIWHSLEGSPEQMLALAERGYRVAPRIPTGIGLLAGALSRSGEREKAERVLREIGDGTAYGAPLGMVVYHSLRLEFDEAAGWLEKAIEQRDPNTLPASCGPQRKYYVANGRWPALARLLNIPEAVTSPSG